VGDPIGRYHSDYDLLVVVDHEDLTDVPEFWTKTEDRLLDELSGGKALRTPVSVIYHSIADVNEKLELGRYFFMDIVREGIVLHEEVGHPFAEPRPLSSDEALRETRDYYEKWFESAVSFLKIARYAADEGRPKEAAFLLHQATERFYHCLILVRTLYSPRTHSLNRLRKLAEELEPRLVEVSPRDSKLERRSYELLRAAYVKARYSRHYRITAEELEWLGADRSAPGANPRLVRGADRGARGGGLILPRISGGGGPRGARWRGSSERGGAPPPCFAWSPSPANAGEDLRSMSARRAGRRLHR
jgi:HEPN domain-containing protein